jgi:hypothetical protein
VVTIVAASKATLRVVIAGNANRRDGSSAFLRFLGDCGCVIVSACRSL